MVASKDFNRWMLGRDLVPEFLNSLHENVVKSHGDLGYRPPQVEVRAYGGVGVVRVDEHDVRGAPEAGTDCGLDGKVVAVALDVGGSVAQAVGKQVHSDHADSVLDEKAGGA